MNTGLLSLRYRAASNQLQRLLTPVLLLMLRLLIARVFLLSGLTKWNGWFDFNTDKYDLFLYEFFCPDPIRPGALLLCNPNTLDYTEGSWSIVMIKVFAVTAGVMEILLPVMLIMGLFSRAAALGLLFMVGFIQLAVFPEWSHWWNPAVWWVAILSVVLVMGPGRFSLDRLFKLE
ncbi:DoxX family protein [Gynuella sunshinyii]|uniref:Putative membrane protein n=1 Tax=Gynuella sunshinyii YC6258 TaxID=1445510 RepID=A0A0C5VGZ9_9GAMM|nr:DoxX family protein [Gynuella sunshinyii]AJQ93506.1 putative membrane protein [Gynuella sunshinyii YC6258]